MEKTQMIWFIFICLRFTNAEFIEFYFDADIRFENALFSQDNLWTQTGVGLLQCVLACSSTSDCVSFSFGQSTCYAYSNRAHVAMLTTPQPNTMYFESKGVYGNLARDKPASQKVTFTMPVLGTYTAGQAVDGGRDPRPFLPFDSCALVDKGVATWWKVDLLQPYMVTSVAILARNTMPIHAANLEIGVGLLTTGPFSVCLSTSGAAGWINSFSTFTCPVPLYGQFVKITKIVSNQYMCLCEVEVYGK